MEELIEDITMPLALAWYKAYDAVVTKFPDIQARRQGRGGAVVLPSPTEPTDAVGRSPDETLAWKGGYRKGYDNISGLSIENSRGLGASSRKRVVQSNALSKRAKDVYLCRQHAPICPRSKTAPLPVAIACGADAPAVRMGDP